jgi:hypothetical protein
MKRDQNLFDQKQSPEQTWITMTMFLYYKMTDSQIIGLNIHIDWNMVWRRLLTLLRKLSFMAMNN